MVGRFNRWARGWLWTWAVLFAFVLLLVRLLGSWSTAWTIYRIVAITLIVASLVGLAVAGWIEWREKRLDRGSSEDRT